MCDCLWVWEVVVVVVVVVVEVGSSEVESWMLAADEGSGKEKMA